MIKITQNRLVFSLGLILFFLPFFSVSAMAEQSPEIQWQSYDTGIQMIKEQNKKGFLHFYTDWCTYCKVMNNQTFVDSQVIDYLNENFVSMRINADQQKSIARKYSVSRFPNTWFISEDASALTSQPGFIPPEMLLNMLKFLHTDSFKTMKFSEFMKSQDPKSE